MLQEQQEQPLQQAKGVARAVWELNRLRRLLAYEVLQWATALHEGTPMARAAPPQAVVASALSESLGRHSREGSLDSAAAADTARAAAAAAVARQQQQQQQAAAGQEGGSGAAAEPVAVGEEAGPAVPAAAAQAAAAEAPGRPPLPPEARLAAGHYRRSSVSLGQHIRAAMPAAAAPSPAQLSSANLAPTLQRESVDSGAPAASGPEQPAITIGLVARYVSLFDDSRARGPGTSAGAGGASEPRAAAQAAQQRTLDWVQRALPPEGDLAAAPSQAGSQPQPAQPGPAQRQAAQQHQQQQVASCSPGAMSSLSGVEDEEEALAGPLEEGPLPGGAQGALQQRLRRPSMRIDLANPDPELASAFGPPSAEPLEGECAECAVLGALC